MAEKRNGSRDGRNPHKKHRAESPRSTKSLNDLPNELLTTIVDFIHENNSEPDSATKTYRSLSLTSRKFHRITTPYLHHTYCHICGERSSLFFRSLFENPTLAAFVKEVRTIEGPYSGEDSEDPPLTSKFHTACRMNYRNKIHPEVYEYLSRFRTDCISRGIRGALSEEAELCAIVWLLPNLQQLYWGDSFENRHWRPKEEEDLSEIWPYMGIFLGALVKLAKLPQPTGLEHHFFSLKKLRTDMGSSDNGISPPDLLSPILRLPSLKTLEVCRLEVYESVPEWESIKSSNAIEELMIWDSFLVSLSLAQLISTAKNLKVLLCEVKSNGDIGMHDTEQLSPLGAALHLHSSSLERVVLDTDLGSCLGSLEHFQSLAFVSVRADALLGLRPTQTLPLHALLPQKLKDLRITVDDEAIAGLTTELFAFSTRIKDRFTLLRNVLITTEEIILTEIGALREAFEQASVKFSNVTLCNLSCCDLLRYANEVC